jgi:hypothetical protein
LSLLARLLREAITAAVADVAAWDDKASRKSFHNKLTN